MKQNIDVQELKKRYLLSEIVAKDIKIIKCGIEYKACCPFHDDRTPSMTINDQKGVFNCFGCNETGDMIDYIKRKMNLDFMQAMQYLSNEPLPARNSSRPQPENKVYPTEEFLYPPADAPKFIVGERTSFGFIPTYVHAYKDSGGKLFGYMLRHSDKFGKKSYKPVKWSKEGWILKGFAERGSLYRVETLSGSPEIVYVVEGEKTADSCAELTGCKSVTWVGGVNSVSRADWTPLANKEIIIWPDWDEQGRQAALTLIDILLEMNIPNIKLIHPDNRYAPKWDAADFLEDGGTKEKFEEWVHNKIEVVSGKSQILSIPEPKSKQEFPDTNMPFRVLGYNSGIYYYLPKRSQQIITLNAPQHTKLNFLELANLEWWEQTYSTGRSIPWDSIASSLMDLCYKKGIFLPQEMVKGRGAWIEDGHKILHLGNRILVDNIEYLPTETPTKSIYEAAHPINIPASAPLKSKESQLFLELCERFVWENPLSGRLLAGWCVIAPICGMLPWRPHIWIVGESGSGKTTILNYIMKKMLSFFSLQVEGTTTEAGIRQYLGNDAMPIIFDEAEAEDKDSAKIMRQILTFSRIASTGGSVLKGAATGNCALYTARSMFCFSAINPSLDGYADASRVTKLTILTDKRQDKRALFNVFLTDMMYIITPKFAGGMILRAIENLETLLYNSEIFNKTTLELFSDKRHADQISPMLAGAYLCESNDKISIEQAREWLMGFDWGDQASNLSKDNQHLLEYLMSYKLPVYLSDQNRRVEETIGNIILYVADSTNSIERKSYAKAIGEIGIKVGFDNASFIIINKSSVISSILKDTVWRYSWAQTLKTLPFAIHTTTNAMSFSAGLKGRGIQLPIEMIAHDE